MRIAGILLGMVLAVVLTGTAVATPSSGAGNVAVGVDVSIWDSSLPVGPGILPIGGAGQVNGEFVTAERLGIQIGLRAEERFEGPLVATASEDGRLGIYEASTGTSDTSGRATWNYDWHVDLRNAYGVAAGTTLADYDLTLETDMFASQFSLPVPLDLTFDGAVPGDLVLYQQSHNPVFGASGFNPQEPGIYNLRLVLTPKSFSGPPLAVAIQVAVS